MNIPGHYHQDVILHQGVTGLDGWAAPPTTSQAASRQPHTLTDTSYQSQSQRCTSNEASTSSEIDIPGHYHQAVIHHQGGTGLDGWAASLQTTSQAAAHQPHTRASASYQSQQAAAACPDTTQPSSDAEQKFPPPPDLGPLNTMDVDSDDEMDQDYDNAVQSVLTDLDVQQGDGTSNLVENQSGSPMETSYDYGTFQQNIPGNSHIDTADHHHYLVGTPEPISFQCRDLQFLLSPTRGSMAQQDQSVASDGMRNPTLNSQPNTTFDTDSWQLCQQSTKTESNDGTGLVQTQECYNLANSLLATFNSQQLEGTTSNPSFAPWGTRDIPSSSAQHRTSSPPSISCHVENRSDSPTNTSTHGTSGGSGQFLQPPTSSSTYLVNTDNSGEPFPNGAIPGERIRILEQQRDIMLKCIMNLYRNLRKD